MEPRLVLSEALRALTRHKLRTLLTVLSLAVGVGALICVVAIGNGGNAEMQQQLLNLGDNPIWIEAGSRGPGVVH